MPLCFSWRAPRVAWAPSLFVAFACSSVPPEATDVVVSKVEGGEVDADAKHVFRVLARVTGFNELCSATLIAPHLMLTARHCVAPTPSGNVNCDTDRFGPAVAPTELKFSNAVEPDLSSRWFDADSVMVSSDSDFTCGYDIAVVLLKQPVPPAVAIPAEPRFLPQIRSGETYSAIGYGGSDADERAAEYGVRHSRANLSVACGQNNACPDSTVRSQEFLGTEGACKGDSGGPAIDSAGQVIGVLSRGAEGCESPIYVGVPAFETLLVAAAEQASRKLGADLPVWAGGTAAAEPTTPFESTEPPKDDAPSASTGGDSGADADGRQTPETTLAQEGCAITGSGGGSLSPWLALLAALGLRRMRLAAPRAIR